ncbi:uncharacterized protein LOC123443948 isoform X2 [Hordeum vulgare subsp. vulgare]|uniref:uncharacterized protein LOC123443948 isoform X2 n=1 Tax=Hordeum vulgare subsp. vulgare TaxID=112509 RepID=UPI001D1A4A39|nr:uncharacterized protein LOC123443948 isoform X2 [Hordeum vulgare subsp. vulgare]
MDQGRDPRAENTHQAIFYAYGTYLCGSQGAQISHQQQWLSSGASNQVPSHGNSWIQHRVYGFNSMHGNAENNAMPTTSFANYNTFDSKEMSLPTNLESDTLNGKSNKISCTLQQPVNTMSQEGHVSYMQLLLAAEQEGAMYGSSQSQQDHLVHTENDTFMITGRYGRSPQQLSQAETGFPAQHSSEVDTQEDPELEPFIDNRFRESLNDLN